MAKVLVTGAAGFVGVALCKALRARGDEVIAAVRSGAQAGQMNVGDIGPDTDWSTALQGCDAVIHLAARVHVMADREQDPMRAYRSVNVDATLNLAAQAMRHGVRRFVFVSSVKVNGEATTDRPFSAADVPMPCDPYGQSKLEAERGLAALAATGCLEVAIVRPPLVYGPGVKANFLNLMRLVERGLPLPFGRVRNARSMVALGWLLATVLANYPQVRLLKIEDGKGRKLGRSYGVTLWPTLIFLIDGVEVTRQVRPVDVDGLARAMALVAPMS